MQKIVQSEADAFLAKKRRRRLWTKVVSVLGCVVVFCTTYALILPAITAEKTICGLEEHTHSDECYAPLPAEAQTVLSCTVETLGIHSHTESCYDADGNLICGQADYVVHSHDENCYDADGVLVCTLPERTAHVHTDACYTTVEETHVHTDACYELQQGELICGLEENEEHQHSDGCYEQLKILICPLEEGAVVSRSVLTCGEVQAPAHQHTESCFETVEPVRELICELPEHVHTDACYEELTPGDPTADLETAADWEATMSGVVLTGDYRADLLAIAETQLGYCESTRNFIIDEAGLIKGYTRYGQWYGIPYGDWCAMFVSFCLRYAQVPNFPYNAGCTTWINALSAEEYGLYEKAGEYEPQPGDIIFFDLDGDQSSDHVGIVQAVSGTTISTIEGNVADTVCSVTYESGSSAILGFGRLPEKETGNPCGKTAHTHSQYCYGYGGSLLCPFAEHTHSEECQSESELIEEDQALVVEVTALIDALPSYEEIEETLTAFDEAEDYEGYEAYFVEVQSQAKAAYDAYDALTDAQKEKVTNVDKLMDLSWLWSAVTLEEDTSPDASTIEPVLNGDYAYLTDVKMKADPDTESKLAIRTGTSPFDADDEAGNDSTELNNILRTFDTATFTIQFNTKLRDEVQQQDISGYEKGRLYFEFILPASAEKAQFELDSMGWLQSYQEIAYEVATLADGSQVLRGSFMLVPNNTNPAAIGASTNELSIVIRALQMHNGDTLQPTFTLWLQYNDVGTTYSEDGRLPQTIVTGTTHDCGEEGHGQEFATVTGPEIQISAAPRYNIALVNGDASRNTIVGTYDFNATSNKAAPNYGLGQVYGRLNGYGIRIEIRGKSGQGLRGVELPDENTPITFDLTLTSLYKYGTQSASDDDYRPLFWSGGGNSSSAQNPDGRTVNTQSSYIVGVPFNILGSSYNSCKNGGTWSFSLDEENLNTVHVTVTGFTVDTTHFPQTYPAANSLTYTYYNPNNINNYWEIEQAIFSCGELWVLQPYNSLTDGTYIVTRYGADGSFYTTIKDSNLYMKDVSGVEVTTQAVTSDDTLNSSRYLKSPGTIDAQIHYLKYQTRVWNEALTDGAYGTDNDWAAAGQGVTLQSYISHDGSEGEKQGVAYDNLIKFDDNFFEPNGTVSANGTNVKCYWAAKPDKTGWTSEDEMKQATEDDLVFYASLDELKAAGAVPVGLLTEIRGVSSTPAGMNHYHTYVDGTIKATCPANQVYMITRTTYAWSKADVAEAALEHYNATYPDSPKATADELTDADYTAYARNAFPSHANSSSLTMLDEDHQFTQDYPDPFWRQDYYICSSSGTSGVNNNSSMLKLCYKASYDSDGTYKPGYGVTYYQDSCLVVPYETTITKATAQTEQGASSSKKVYDMGQNQRTADFVLYPRIERIAGESTSTSSVMSTTVYVQDTLPAGLTYIPGTAYLGGSYAQDPLHQTPGTVTDGQAMEPVIGTDAKGNTTLTWSFEVTMNFNETIWTEPIYFSCTIGTPGNEETDVVNQQQLNNQVIIWTADEQKRPFKVAYGNMAQYGIEVLKTDAVSLSKLADQLVVDWWDPMGFTMNVGNNSANTRKGTVIVETLPYNGLNGTSFHGNLLVTEFSAGAVDTPEHSNTLLSGFTFYYTTDTKWAGCTSAQFMSGGVCSYDFASDSTWTHLTLSETANTEEGRPFGLFENFPDVSAQENQITAIVAVGDLPPSETMKMHITLKLPAGMEKDYLVNYLSQDSLTSYARTQVVNRTLEGLTWMDTNGDGIQGNTTTENRISGVQVSLLKLKDGGDPTKEADYDPYCYPGTDTPIVIETGQMVSVQAADSTTITEYELGRYKFTDLPAGIFAVKFSTGSTDISPLIASPANQGSDDAVDSDGVSVYSSDRTSLERTVILGIEMPEVKEMTYAIYESKNHDSGFYERDYEIPNTGGAGTTLYTIGGLLLIVSASLLLLYNHTKRRKEDFTSS